MGLKETAVLLAGTDFRSAQGMRSMNVTQSATTVSTRAGDLGRDDLAWLFDARPEARVAIRERLERFPEYGVWLQGLASGVLYAVERDSKDTHAGHPTKKVTFAP
jgi:hypothetical protein